MSRYSTSDKRQDERRWKIHPIWRGIGCVMILLIVILAYFGADVFLEVNRTAHLLPLTYDLVQAVDIPRIKVPATAIDFKINLPASLTYIKLILTMVFMFIGFGFLTVVYSVFYKFMGPPRYNRFDAPQPKKLKKQW